MAADETDELDYKPRNPWPARIGALLVIVGGTCSAAGFLWFREPPTQANRMLVAVTITPTEGDPATWWASERHTDGTRVATRLHDAVVKGFETIDLEIVSRETPRALQALGGADDLRSRRRTAAELGAAWLLTGAITTTSRTPIAESGWVEYTFDADLKLVPSTGSGEAVDLPSPVRFRSRGRSELDGVSRIVDDIAKLAAPPALDALAAQPRVQHYADVEGLSVEEQIVADQLRRFFRYTADRRAALEAHAEREAGGADLERQWGLDPATRIGPWLGWEVMVGHAGPGKIVLKVDELRPELPITDRTVELVEVHETLVVANEDGTGRERIFDAYNFYGWPRSSLDGKHVYGVLDERGVALTMIRVAVEGGEVLRLLSSETDYYGNPTPSPDGTEIAYWWQPCRGCTAELRVLPIATLQPRTIFHNVEGTIGDPSWSADGGTVYVSVVPPGRPGSIWAVGAEDGAKTLLAGPGDGQRGSSFSYAEAAPDGSYVAAIETDPKGVDHLVVVRLDSGKIEQLVHGALQDLEVSPDSARIAVRFVPEGSWYSDVGVVDAGSGAFEPVTRADRRDGISGWSAASDALYTHQEERGETQFYRVYRHAL